MKRLIVAFSALLLAGSLALVEPAAVHAQKAGETAALLDGKTLDAWTTTGDANWRIEDGAVVASKGTGFLVTKASYTDFEIKAEFWVNDEANSGIFIRCQDPAKIGAANAYEVNIYDQRPDPSYGTGAIVDVAKVVPMPKAGGKWNTYEITAKGGHLVVVLNGQKTVDVMDDKHKTGPIGLQYADGVAKGAGIVKFRKFEIKPL